MQDHHSAFEKHKATSPKLLVYLYVDDNIYTKWLNIFGRSEFLDLRSLASRVQNLQSKICYLIKNDY